ncbi:hypothetical protein [Rossellomorea aquimaris]|uniref:Uncharacterized protein n=1 Tax=Rossellomorea aquimaris TaxID=189382 RepID=A0A5D4TLC0_9BACI|nr:hypothetical protein [Rossellomorea aquimaris]TYS76590.1 hypothetical protein FZC80_14905 [Rossellomorea aquimaris]
MRRNKLSFGEEEFIKGCTKAIIKKDTSKHHRLYVLKNGIRRYVAHDNPNEDLVYENGELVKCICIVSKEFILDFHYKAGNDDLSKPWIRKGLLDVMKHGEKVAETLYK